MAEHDNARNCTGPVSNLTDFVPLLQYLPNAFTMRAKQLHKDIVETYGGMLNQIEQRINYGEDVPHCLAKKLIEMNDRETSCLDRLEKVMICAAFTVGGVESVRDYDYRIFIQSSNIGTNILRFQTASIIQWFSALIPSYPDIQGRAHAELDRVVGRNRLPTVEDEKDLPYVRAIIKVCTNTLVVSGELLLMALYRRWNVATIRFGSAPRI